MMLDKYTEIQVKRIDDALQEEESSIKHCTYSFEWKEPLELHTAKRLQLWRILCKNPHWCNPRASLRRLLEPKSI